MKNVFVPRDKCLRVEQNHRVKKFNVNSTVMNHNLPTSSLNVVSYNLAITAEHLNITLGTPVTAILDGERCAPAPPVDVRTRFENTNRGQKN
jgi:hypothetical protein